MTSFEAVALDLYHQAVGRPGYHLGGLRGLLGTGNRASELWIMSPDGPAPRD